MEVGNHFKTFGCCQFQNIAFWALDTKKIVRQSHTILDWFQLLLIRHFTLLIIVRLDHFKYNLPFSHYKDACKITCFCNQCKELCVKPTGPFHCSNLNLIWSHTWFLSLSKYSIECVLFYSSLLCMQVHSFSHFHLLTFIFTCGTQAL